MKIFLLIAAAVAAFSAVSALPEIDPALQNLVANATANVLVTISNRTSTVLADLKAQTFSSRAERLNAVHDALLSHASATQVEVLEALAPFTSAINFTSYYISNQVSINGATKVLIDALAVLPSVAKIEKEFFARLVSPALSLPSLPAPSLPAVPGLPLPPLSLPSLGQLQIMPTLQQIGLAPPTGNTYGVSKIQAPDAWKEGYTGQGVTVASIDTGVRFTHTRLASRFLGKYGWYDATNPFGLVPTDLVGHGTHTMGTMTGSGGIGVAPGATWASCKACDIDSTMAVTCSNTALLACGEFFLCPTDTPTKSKNCTKAPHVINNSWDSNGNSSWYNDVLAAWETAGIISVFASGNNGPSCGTLLSPGDQPGTITVGATDQNDVLAPYSSVGPSGNGLMKPDLVAPGTNVTSAYYLTDTSFAVASGTSMAAPHVAGTVALLLSKNPNLTFDDVYKALTSNCDQSGLLGTGQNCGGIADSSYPNWSLGYGRVNAVRAVNSL